MVSFFEKLFDQEVGFCRHRPLFGWTMALAFGTGLGYFFGGAWGWLLLATGLLFAAWRTKTISVAVALWGCCFALAAWRAALLHDRNEAVLTQLREYQAAGTLFELKVVVANDRQIVQRKRGGPYCRFSADEAWLPDGTEVHGTNLLVYYYDRKGDFPETGETWLLKAKLRGGAYLHRLSLSARGEHARPLPQENRQSALQYRLASLRNRLAETLALGVSEAEALLTQTMVLGTRSRLPMALRQRYADAGILHIFAISGLHVGIIAGLLIWLLSWLGVRLRMRIFLILPALLGYLLLTGIPPSAARACLMAIIFCFAPSILRKSDGASALFATAAVVLLIEPGWIANVGALLSFCVMGGIFLFTKPFAYFLNRFFRSAVHRTPDGALAEELPWHLILRQRVAMILGLSCAAWLSVLPLSLFFFGRVSVVGLLLNLFVPSLVVMIVWCACLSVLFGWWLPVVAVALNNLNALLFALIDRVSAGALRLPFSAYELEHRPGVTLVLIMGLGLVSLGMWLGCLERTYRKKDPLDPENFRFLPESSPELR